MSSALPNHADADEAEHLDVVLPVAEGHGLLLPDAMQLKVLPDPRGFAAALGDDIDPRLVPAGNGALVEKRVEHLFFMFRDKGQNPCFGAIQNTNSMMNIKKRNHQEKSIMTGEVSTEVIQLSISKMWNDSSTLSIVSISFSFKSLPKNVMVSIACLPANTSQEKTD